MAETALVRAALSVPDISCAHCVQTVTGALAPLGGVADVSVDLPTKTVQVAFDPRRVSLKRISEVLAEEAYPVASERIAS